MRVLKKLTDAVVGCELNFRYEGGSNPGSVRNVTVEDVLDDRIIAIDHDRGDDVRCFLVDKATSITVTEESVAVPFPAEASCDIVDVAVMPEINPPKGMRAYVKTLDFGEIQERLVNQVYEMTGEELAAVACDMEEADGAAFDKDECNVVIVKYVPEPKFVPIPNGIKVVNEREECMLVSIAQDKVLVEGLPVNPEEFLTKLAHHLA